MTNHSLMINPSRKDHLMLLYEDENRLDDEVIQVINEGLERGQLCVYASVHVSDRDRLSRIFRQIPDFEKQLQEGNLLVVDFKPFYDLMLKGDLTLFRQLKHDLEEWIQSRNQIEKSPSAIVVADCAGYLSKNRHFDQSIALEDWWHETFVDWQRNNVDIAMVCPHPSSILHQETFSHELGRLSRAHSLTLDMIKSQSVDSHRTLQNTVSTLPVSSRHAPIRILVAEPEPDIRAIYHKYLNYQGITLTVASDGAECLENLSENGKHQGSAYDMIILDWHLRDTSSESILKQIREKLPDQRIIVTCTEINGKRKELEAMGIEILEKPFRFSELLSVIKPAEPTIS